MPVQLRRSRRLSVMPSSSSRATSTHVLRPPTKTSSMRHSTISGPQLPRVMSPAKKASTPGKAQVAVNKKSPSPKNKQVSPKKKSTTKSPAAKKAGNSSPRRKRNASSPKKRSTPSKKRSTPSKSPRKTSPVKKTPGRRTKAGSDDSAKVTKCLSVPVIKVSPRYASLLLDTPLVLKKFSGKQCGSGGSRGGGSPPAKTLKRQSPSVTQSASKKRRVQTAAASDSSPVLVVPASPRSRRPLSTLLSSPGSVVVDERTVTNKHTSTSTKSQALTLKEYDHNEKKQLFDDKSMDSKMSEQSTIFNNNNQSAMDKLKSAGVATPRPPIKRPTTTTTTSTSTGGEPSSSVTFSTPPQRPATREYCLNKTSSTTTERSSLRRVVSRKMTSERSNVRLADSPWAASQQNFNDSVDTLGDCGVRVTRSRRAAILKDKNQHQQQQHSHTQQKQQQHDSVSQCSVSGGVRRVLTTFLLCAMLTTLVVGVLVCAISLPVWQVLHNQQVCVTGRQRVMSVLQWFSSAV